MENLINSLVVNTLNHCLGMIVSAPKEPKADGQFLVDVKYTDGKTELVPFPFLIVVGRMPVKQMVGNIKPSFGKKTMDAAQPVAMNEFGHTTNLLSQ